MYSLKDIRILYNITSQCSSEVYNLLLEIISSEYVWPVYFSLLKYFHSFRQLFWSKTTLTKFFTGARLFSCLLGYRGLRDCFLVTCATLLACLQLSVIRRLSLLKKFFFTFLYTISVIFWLLSVLSSLDDGNISQEFPFGCSPNCRLTCQYWSVNKFLKTFNFEHYVLGRLPPVIFPSASHYTT